MRSYRFEDESRIICRYKRGYLEKIKIFRLLSSFGKKTEMYVRLGTSTSRELRAVEINADWMAYPESWEII